MTYNDLKWPKMHCCMVVIRYHFLLLAQTSEFYWPSGSLITETQYFLKGTPGIILFTTFWLDYILTKFRLYLTIFWLHSDYNPTTFWLHSDYILTTFWPHSDYIMTAFWQLSDYILTIFWQHSDYILTTLWLFSGFILTTFWIHSDYIMAIFWLHSDYILTTL